jgi:hypothetical protein
VCAVSGSERLLRRLNNAETVSTGPKGTAAKCTLGPREVVSALSQLAGLA